MKSNEIKNKMSKLKTCLEVANDNLNDVRKLEIKDDEHKFTDSLRHTIIRLVLKSHVSMVQVNQVIKTMLESLTNYRIETDMPSRKSIQNFIDEGNAMPKFLVYEELNFKVTSCKAMGPSCRGMNIPL